MTPEERLRLRDEAAAEFERHERRSDGLRVATALADGLKTLRDLCFARVHLDVEQRFGQDSMLAPTARLKTASQTKLEIEIFQIAEAIIEARERNYVADADWFAGWLMHLRLGSSAEVPAVRERLKGYLTRSEDDRRRDFSVTLEKTMREATRAPLVLYRLLPWGVALATANAFGDAPHVAECRRRQVAILPGISDCHVCHGALFEPSEQCSLCGNPLWKHDWLSMD